MESKGVVEQIVVQNSNNQDEIYDIAASGKNVSYNENMNIVEKIDEIANQIDDAINGKVNSDGGSLANTVAGDVTSQGSVSEIISTDRGSTIWGKINAIISNLRRKVDSDGGSLENTKAGSISPTSLSSITSSDKGSIIWGKINSLITKTNSIETSLINKIDKSGGSVANAIAGYVNTQSSSTDITSSDALSTIWGKFNKLREEVFTNHKYSTVYRNSTNLNKLGGPPHGIKYQDGSLQIYVPNNASSASTQDAGSWIPIMPKLVTWANGSDTEINAMLNAHYNNVLDIECFWSVGDARTFYTNRIPSSSYIEGHRSQKMSFVILDFNHDKLTNPINNHTYAAITVQQRHCLATIQALSEDDGEHNAENGCMNLTDTNIGGWTQSVRRAWCNEVYLRYGLPQSFGNLIKPVDKLTTAGGNQLSINTDSDYIFFLSEIETFGSFNFSGEGEGNQYQYFINDIENVIKYPKWRSSSDSGMQWWLRSPVIESTDTKRFCCAFNPTGITTIGSPASNLLGIAPAFCL